MIRWAVYTFPDALRMLRAVHMFWILVGNEGN